MMNAPVIRSFILLAIPFFTINMCFAQERSAQNTLKLPPPAITIDGDLKDWGDSLRYLNTDKHITYSLANDKDNLYMAIRLNDYGEQMMVLNAGLTLAIDTKGKKKESFIITFPVGPDGGPTSFGMPGRNAEDSLQQKHEELVEAELTKLRGIKVVGFTDIEGNYITTSNTYGIKTAIDYDKDGNLVCEAAVPLKFFHADNISKNEWAFNFKINGINNPAQDHDSGEQQSQGRGGRGGGMGGGRGGRGGGMGGGRGGRGGNFGGGRQIQQRSELSKSVDFWEKFYLAGQ